MLLAQREFEELIQAQPFSSHGKCIQPLGYLSYRNMKTDRTGWHKRHLQITVSDTRENIKAVQADFFRFCSVHLKRGLTEREGSTEDHSALWQTARSSDGMVTSCTNIANRETERTGRKRGEGDQGGGTEGPLESLGRKLWADCDKAWDTALKRLRYTFSLKELILRKTVKLVLLFVGYFYTINKC